MKKQLLTILLAAVLFLTAPSMSVLAADVLTSDQDVVDLFLEKKEAGADKFEFTVSEDLFDRLMENYGHLLHVLEIKGGISDASVSYSKQSRTIYMSRVVYSDLIWAECTTEKEACRAVQDLLSAGDREFLLLTPVSLLKTLANSGNLKTYAAQAGFVNTKIDYYTNGDIYVKGAEPFTLPWAAVEDSAQFNAAIESFAEENTEEFYIVFAPPFFDKLYEDQEMMDQLHAASMLETYRYSSGSAGGVLHYSGVSYTEDPCSICYTEEEIVEAISRMGALGLSNFRIYLAEDLKDSVLGSNLSHLHELEAQAGMSTAALSYSSRMIYYSDAKIVSDAVPLKTLEDALAYMAEKTSEAAEDITLFCEPGLYSTLLGKAGSFSLSRDGMDPIYDLISQSGIYDYDLSSSRSTGAVMIHVHTYYPGTEILYALETDQEDELSGRLQETLESARELAEECLREDPLATALAIHDALCERVVYVDDEETDEDDTATGALLNGEANCDGYSDAFYLTGTLAGLKIRYQHGDSLVRGSGIVLIGDTMTHMWNLLEIDGTWRMVDVTWDDHEPETAHTWFNLGADRASRTHKWNEEMTVEMLEITDMDTRPENEYSVLDRSEMEAAVDLALAKGESFSLIFDDENYTDHQEALNYIRANMNGAYQYSWVKEMRLLEIIVDPQ